MSMDSRGARLTRRDVVELATASQQLAAVSQTILRSGVKWGAVTVNLLIAVNNTILRIQNKGAGAFARYLEKHPPQSPEAAAVGPIPDQDANQVAKSTPGEDEED